LYQLYYAFLSFRFSLKREFPEFSLINGCCWHFGEWGTAKVDVFGKYGYVASSWFHSKALGA